MSDESDFYRSRAHISSVRKYRKLRSIRLVTTDRFIEKYFSKFRTEYGEKYE